MQIEPRSGADPSNVAAMIVDELAALAADAKTLGARLSAGDIVRALVLPSNGLTDLVQIGGLRVAADLPPSLVPGETISVMVTGFEADRITLQIVSSEPDARGPAPRAAGSAATPSPLPAEGSIPTEWPVHAGAGAPLPSAPPRPMGSAAGSAGGLPAAPKAPAPAAPLHNIEARLAAAHAASPPAARPAGPPSRGLAPPTFAARPGPVAPNGAPRPPPASTPQPTIAPRPASSPQPTAGGRAATPVADPKPTAAPVAARGPAAFAEPAALLRGLHLPVSPTNLAAARMALESPERLPNALATLERALANTADPRLATLTALTAFVARLDPRSPALGAQIAAFVDHVVTGREARLAQLAGATESAAPEAPPEGSGAKSPGGPASRANRDALPPPIVPRAVVIRAGLDFDLKSQLLTLAATRAASADSGSKAAALDRAVAGALTAITALQLNAASTLAAHPDGLSFALPVALADGFASAQVRIARDAPDGSRAPLDGDNFHLAFVLETRHLGTVAIELVTVGRTVTVGVKTEAAAAQRVFGRALRTLTARLESLRYRVAKAEAIVAPPAPVSAPSDAPPAPKPAAPRLVDVDA